MRTWIAGLAALALSACGGNAGNEAEAPAPTGPEAAVETDTVIYTATSIITMDPANPRAEAVAVRDDRIVGVGSLDALTQEMGDRAEIDRRFADHIITPGLIDQHVHPWLAAATLTPAVISIEGWDTTRGFSPAVREETAYRERLAAAVAAHDVEFGPFLSWGYHHYFHGEMNRAYLDSLSTDFPIVVWHRSAHEIFLNSTAIEFYEIDDAFLETFSDMQRAQTNIEDGHFFETGAEKAVERVGEAILQPASMMEGFAFALAYLHRSGITTIAEPGGLDSPILQTATNMVFGPDEAPLNSYYIPDGKGLALAHLGDGPDALIAATEEAASRGEGRAQFLPRQVKIFADGAIFSQAMQMRAGYSNDSHGEWMMEPPQFDAAFQAYWDAGYQIHIHQNGTLGLDMLIASLASAMERAPREDHRTTVVHYGFAAPDQIPQLAELGAIVSANPYYVANLAQRYSEFGVGSERVETMMVPLRSTVDAGISLSLHSDMPMAAAKPLLLIEAAVTRNTLEGTQTSQHERLTVDQALRAVTIDAAYSVRLEDEIGSIEVGKQADFTILEADPYAVAPDQIAEIGIWGTILEGRLQPIEAE